jgi:hypothetical protein
VRFTSPAFECFVVSVSFFSFQALLPLALERTSSVGMTKATQALAKIAITTNPEIAFPGQRVC